MRLRHSWTGQTRAIERLVGVTAVVVLLLSGLVQLQDSLHLHARCPEHGESIHIDGSAPAGEHAPAHGSVSSSDRDDDDEHCNVWSLSQTSAHHSCALHVQAGPDHLVVVAGARPAIVSATLLRFAPKTSPPAQV